MDRVRTIGSVVKLDCTGKAVGLEHSEDRRREMDSKRRCAVIRLSDLRGKKIRSLDGKALGRVHEVHANGGRSSL